MLATRVADRSDPRPSLRFYSMTGFEHGVTMAGSPEIMSLSAGQRFAQYEIVSPLGSGGMGEVYRARDLRLGRDVAIKVMAAHVAADPEMRARFETEARSGD